MAKRKRRSFTTEFKAQAVRIVRESGKPVGTVARELNLTETALRSWVRQPEIEDGERPGFQPDVMRTALQPSDSSSPCSDTCRLPSVPWRVSPTSRAGAHPRSWV